MGRNTIYPYLLWNNGEWHEIHPSTFNKTLPTLRSILHQYARARGKKLLTKTVDEDTLLICFKAAPRG